MVDERNLEHFEYSITQISHNTVSLKYHTIVLALFVYMSPWQLRNANEGEKLSIDSKPERMMYLPTDVSSSEDNGIETILFSPFPSLSLPDISHNNDNK